MFSASFGHLGHALGILLPRADIHLAYADAASALYFSRRGAPVRAAPVEGGVVQGGSWAQAPSRGVIGSGAATLATAATPRMIAVGVDSREDVERDEGMLSPTPHIIAVMVPPRIGDSAALVALKLAPDAGSVSPEPATSGPSMLSLVFDPNDSGFGRPAMATCATWASAALVVLKLAPDAGSVPSEPAAPGPSMLSLVFGPSDPGAVTRSYWLRRRHARHRGHTTHNHRVRRLL